MEQGTTRERILREAVRLFAEHGYAGTSVADIQRASGLTPGSGALYKHFPSKYALLEAAVDRHLKRYEDTSSALLPALPERPSEALELIGRGVLTALAEDRDLVRIMLRDLDQFPELHANVTERLLPGLYGDTTRWLDDEASGGRVRPHDSAAVSAVLIGAITYYRILDALLGVAPGGVDEERFLAAWLELADRGLRE